MSDRTVHTLRILVAVVAAAGAIVSSMSDGPEWLSVAGTVIATALALVTRLEAILGIDIDGDGSAGPPSSRNRSRPAPRPGVRDVSIILVALGIVGCSGQQTVAPGVEAGFGSLWIGGHGCIDGEATWDGETWVGDLAVAGQLGVTSIQWVDLWGLRVPSAQLVQLEGAADDDLGTDWAALGCLEVGGQRWCPVDTGEP